MMETDLKKLKITLSRIELLNTMEIYRLNDLITYYPYRYDVLKATIPNEESDKIIVEATIIDLPKVFFIRKNMTRMSFKVSSQYGEYLVSIFNRHFLKRNLTLNKVITIIGKLDKNKHSIIANDIKFQPLSEIEGIYPVYSVKKGMTSKSMQNYILKALKLMDNDLIDFIPEEFIQKHQLIYLKEALKEIHQPTSEFKLKQAIKYLKYEEFLKFQLTMMYIKRFHHLENVGVAKMYDQMQLNEYIYDLPFKLTDDQIKVSIEILKDMQSSMMMDRLIQGDVGSGKTVVASIAIYANYLAGYQSALMAPTEILASQHLKTLQSLFKNTPIKIGLLTGSLNAKDKREMQHLIAINGVDVVVGTHALIQDQVQFKNLGLVIADEQHRFGVNQRKKLQDKGNQTDLLTMSATPIPRTLAMIMYGDKDVSTIKTKPSHRQQTITKVIKTRSMKPILKELEDYIANGGQCYVVCPLVDESENMSNVNNATSIYNGMVKYYQNRMHIGLLHGKMSDETKEETMQQFVNHEIDILVSTTVIEVGVDVQNANMIVIYDAHRFGLSQLHQLRGRVGRSNKQGKCYLFTSSTDQEALDRLHFLETHDDGFEVSEYDLNLRGPGEMLGQRQSGLPSFLIADVLKDFNILEIAKNDASMIIEHIEDKKYFYLKQILKNKIQNNDTYLD